MSTDYATTGMIGVNIDSPSTTADHALGTVTHGNANTIWVYVQASEAVATGTCTVDGSFALTDAAGTYTADVAFASGEYGWVKDTTGATA